MDIAGLFYALKIICCLVIISTWIWLLIYLFPVIRTILKAVFFPPKLPPIDPADLPPEGSVYFCDDQNIDSAPDERFFTYVLGRTDADGDSPDLFSLSLEIMADFCTSRQVLIAICFPPELPKKHTDVPALWLKACTNLLRINYPEVTSYQPDKQTLWILTTGLHKNLFDLLFHAETHGINPLFMVYTFSPDQHFGSAYEAGEAAERNQYDFQFLPPYVWQSEFYLEYSHDAVDPVFVRETVERICVAHEVPIYSPSDQK